MWGQVLGWLPPCEAPATDTLLPFLCRAPQCQAPLGVKSGCPAGPAWLTATQTRDWQVSVQWYSGDSGLGQRGLKPLTGDAGASSCQPCLEQGQYPPLPTLTRLPLSSQRMVRGAHLGNLRGLCLCDTDDYSHSYPETGRTAPPAPRPPGGAGLGHQSQAVSQPATSWARRT